MKIINTNNNRVDDFDSRPEQTSAMETTILDSLKEIGHGDGVSAEIIRSGISSPDFCSIVVRLTNEIHVLAETEEKLTGGDESTLRIELSSFLNELNCPYEDLISGNLNTRFAGTNGLLLLDYLTGELMALQMYHCNKALDKSNVIELQETPTATALKGLAAALGMGTPPANLSTGDLFGRLNNRVDEIIKKAGRNRIGKPLLDLGKSWTDKQWADLQKRHAELDKEYDLRRQMLLTRLDCTIQAFNWSERMKHKQGEILTNYKAKLNSLEKLVKGGTNTDIAALLAARDLLLAIEKSSSAAVVKNTRSKIQRHIIGQVPDRGGRAWEHAPPPPEMPSWQKQRATGGGERGGFRGGRGRGGGGHHHHQQNSHQQQQGGGNYDYNRGGGNRVQSGWSQRGHHQQDRGGGGGSGGYNNNFNNRESEGHRGGHGHGGGRGRGRGSNNYRAGGRAQPY